MNRVPTPRRKGRRDADDDDDADPDLALVRRAGRRAALQAAALVAVSFALCAGLVLVVVVTGQNRAAADQLRTATTHAEDVTDPAAGIGLALRHPGGRVELSAGAAAVLPDRVGMAAVLRPGAPAVLVRELHGPDGEFEVRSQRRRTAGGLEVVQAALALEPQHAERGRLLAALAAAGGLALLAAAALGVVTGRRSVEGLVTALGRQRRFVADASHELRTPLTVLSTRAQLLRRHLRSAGLDGPARDVVLADVDRLLTDSRRLAEVVEDLLVASEPGSPGEQVDLAAVSTDVVATLTPFAAEHGVRLVVHLLAPSGDARRDVVRAGGPAVHRSLTALVDNAVRHSPAGATVTVGCRVEGGWGVVGVTDAGPGIPDEVRARLFDRFASGQPADPDPTRPGGPRRYGLGLALLADTVHRSGGRVDVRTGAAGTTFELRLPRMGARPPRRRRRAAGRGGGRL